ncbi:DUF2345 domain-containing protein [Neisseria dumasiana]|uniref:DUF2345 domain-containing protein n=1 Tax=Neisseria dumasiana TaxID=1931275 RepID=UPI00263B5B15|nr:DUF2345 domain-containing protein [Neisseria dumasiana]
MRTWANNKLRMEDKQGQEHIKLATEYGKTQLNLGHIVDSQRQKRGDNGEGFELRTDSWGALRAGKGLFISTDAQNQASGQVLDMSETVKRLEEALSLAKQLDDAAKNAKNDATESQAQKNQLQSSLKDLQHAGIIHSAPGGIATSTPQSQLHTAGSHIHWVSGGDGNISAGKNFTAHAQEGLNLFAQSKGAKLQANQGAVTIQAQNDRMQVNALKDLELSSSSTKVTVAGKQEVMITGGGGSYIQLKDGEIVLGSPKIVRVKAPAMPVGGGDSFNFNGFPLTDKICIPCKIAELTGKPVNPVSGIKVLPDETDFAFDGLVPFVWSRSYFSDVAESGWLGQGWITALSAKLERIGGRFSYTDTQGRNFNLPELSESDGQMLFEAEQIVFERIGNGSYQISSLDGSSKLHFAPLHLNGHDRSGSGNGVYPLIRVSDRFGNGYRIVYDDHGLPAYVTDSLQRTIRFHFTDLRPHEADTEHSPVYRLTHVALQQGTQPDDAADEMLVVYRYNDNGNLSEVYDGRGRLRRRFGYTGSVMTQHQNAAGLTAYYEYDRYDSDGKVLRSHTDAGEEWRFIYAPGHTEITDALGRTEHLYFDHHNEVVKKVFADGSSILTERDALGRPVKVTDEMGRETRYRYNEQGLLAMIGGEGGQNQHIRYNRQLQPVEITRPHGHKTLLEYDAQGRLVKQSDGKGHTTAYRYNNYGQPVQITDAKNNGYFFDYDDNHRLSSTTDCSGKQTRYQYDGKGRVTTITDAAGGTTAYRYNLDGRLENTIYPDGSSEHYHYDEAGRLKAHTDAAGNRTEYAYNSDNQPTERTNALGDTFRYRYDAARRLTELINENGDSYRFAYDERDRLTAETGFDGRATEYTYNPAGELVQENRYGQTHRFGNHRRELLQTTVYHRDRLGRITQKDSHHTDSTRNDSSRYFYDKLNRLTRAYNAHSDLRLSYNSDGLLVKEQYQTLGEPIQPGIIRPRSQDGIPLVTEYRYDILGNRTQTILPTGETLNYLYYGSGHLHHINLDGDTITDIERDDLHRPVSRSAGKLHTRLISDPLGRLKEQLVQLEAPGGKATEPKGLIKRRYHYDTNGNLVQTEDQHHGNKDYAYDPLGRITRAGDERFAFDPAHNISGDGVKVAGNRLTDYNGIRYVYDPLGNLSERHNDATGESQYYRYDADNQLTEARIEQEGRRSEHWHYRYDALGRRVSKQNAHNQTETRFLWEGSRLLQEYGDKATYTYVYTEQGSYEPLAQIVQMANKDSSKADRRILYYHNDQIGIPRELTDAEGNIVWRGEYSGWGKLNNAEGANLKEGVHQPFRLQNQYADAETGLHYNFFRYYDPHHGRFTQQDPIKLAGGESLYAYAPNVQKWMDFSGLQPFDLQAFGISDRAASNMYNQGMNELAKKLNAQAQTYSEYTTGLDVSGDVAAFGKLSGSGGYLQSQNTKGQTNKCAYVTICAGAGAAGGAKAAFQGVYSTQSTSSGVSFPTCTDATGTILGGWTGSGCVDPNTGSFTGTTGPALGAQVGATVKQCVQATVCTPFR